MSQGNFFCVEDVRQQKRLEELNGKNSLDEEMIETRTEGRTLHPSASEEWTESLKIGFRFVVIIVSLFIISLPFPHHLLPDIGQILSPFFEGLVRWSGENIFHLGSSFVSKLLSDSTGLYIHILILVFISSIATLIWTIADRERRNYNELANWFVVIVGYYLAFQLFEYGFNKVFKWQFYLPEPNTLFTTVGETPRDLLYWSVMGTSRSYTIFSGMMEVLAAFLLLFRRTRTLGGLIAFGVLTNVVAINFSFDISVKIYSTLLLLLSLIVMAPDGRRLFRFFFQNGSVSARQQSLPYRTERGFRIYAGTKAIVICMILFDVLSPYVRSGNFNDDTAPRPPLHGAYRVQTFVDNGETIPPLTTIANRWRRVFLHRQGYLIIQTMDDKMRDFRMELDTVNKRMHLTDPEDHAQTILSYAVQTDLDSTTMTLRGVMRGDSIEVQTVKLGIEELPLLRNEFHWTIDEL